MRFHTHEQAHDCDSARSHCPFDRRGAGSAAQLPAHRDANQHPDPRLLREQRPDGAQALVLVWCGHGLEHLGVVGFVEVAARPQRLIEDALQLGGDACDARFRAVEALGVAQRLDRRLQIGVARLAL